MRSTKLVAASGCAIRVEGDAKLEFVGGMKCSMKILDADVLFFFLRVNARPNAKPRRSVTFSTSECGEECRRGPGFRLLA